MFTVADTKAYYWTRSSAILIHLYLEIHPRDIVPSSSHPSKLPLCKMFSQQSIY